MNSSIRGKLKLLRDRATHRQHKISAIILYKGRPISTGFNDQFKTHPKIKQYCKFKTIHAEMSAIFKVKNKDILKQCKMVIYREHLDGNLANARPCTICEQIIKDYNLKSVIYSTSTGWKEESFR